MATMAGPRSYGDPCGIARALDVIGDRWALLIVRELIFGPKRFAQLRSGLHGVSANVLSQRLRELEEAGLVRRQLLDPPAAVAVYQLTGRGLELEHVLLELGRWGSLEPVQTAAEISADALLLALKTVFDPAAAADATVALHVGGDWFSVIVRAGSIDITRARAQQPTVIIEADVATLRSIAFGREQIADAERDGRLTVIGDRQAAELFAGMFPVRRAS